MRNTAYSSLARFYDEVVGERGDDHARIAARIPEDAERICEFGCGTGAALAPFAERYEIYGVDRSPAMLEQARERMPQGSFIEGDIRTAELPIRMDAIIAIYDTMNHVTDLEAWSQVFANAARHLTSNGVFFFDMNTEYRLQLLAAQSPFFFERERYRMRFEVLHIGDRLYRFDVTATFADGSTARDRIPEYVPDPADVHAELSRYFATIHMTDADGATGALEESPRIFVTAYHPTDI